MPGEVSRNLPLSDVDDNERLEIVLHMRAREALALCMADVEDSPGETAYAVADDLLLALDNAGIALAERTASIPNRNREG